MPSSISPARGALHALLVAAPALAGVQVEYGPPIAYEDFEVVALLGISEPSEEAAALGNQRREEVYIIDLAIKAENASGTARSVDVRAFALYDAVRAVIAANPTLSATVRWAQVVRPTSAGSLMPLDNSGQPLPGWRCIVELAIECRARITAA